MSADSAMYQTMHRQPSDLRRLVDEGWEQAAQAVDLIGTSERVILTGIGTSLHAAMVGAWLLRAAGMDARAISAFDLARYPEQFPLGADDSVVVFSHTGETRFPAEVSAWYGAGDPTVIAIGSPTATHPGAVLSLRSTAVETSAAFTSSHLCAMTVIAQVATDLGERREAAGVTGFREALMALPELVAGVLAREAELLPIAEYATTHRVYAAGAGPNEATGLELVIKAREAAYVNIDALAAEQFLHGPMVSFASDDLLVMVNVEGQAIDRTAAIAAVAAKIGGKVLLIGEGVGVGGEMTFALPTLPEVLSPLLTVVPMQVLAHQMAVVKGVNPDTFRWDDERYRDAYAILHL